GLQRGHRLPPTAEQVHADRRELLVPRPEPRRQPGIDRPLLQEPVTARENLTEADERRRVIRIEPGGEPVDEVPAARRPPVHDLEILPPERDRARPLRSRLACRLPSAVLKPRERPANGPARLTPDKVARKGRALGPPAGQFGRPGSAERPPSDDETEGLQEVGFALGVRPSNDVQMGCWRPR